VVNIPEYAEETVAEGAFALMMALARKLKPLQRAMDLEGWVWPTGEWLGSDLAGKTVGLVGLGRIGSAFARMAAAFRMRVLSYDPYVPAATHRNLHAMLAESDFVSIHCVLNDETRRLIGEAELRAMKPGAFLINVSRGAIVDESALLRNLQRGRLAGAALDVYSEEPLGKKDHPLSALYAMDNVILSPHLTFYTREAMARLQADTLERCREALEGRPLTVRSRDPRLRAQTRGVRFVD
jgi:D-3-phosphoglycerate dehydrogenase / 2-oxoglutarate reductase